MPIRIIESKTILREIEDGMPFRLNKNYFIKTTMTDEYGNVICIDLKTGKPKHLAPMIEITPLNMNAQHGKGADK